MAVPRLGIHFSKLEYILVLHAAGMDPLSFEDWMRRSKDMDMRQYNLASEQIGSILQGYMTRTRAQRIKERRKSLQERDWLLQVEVIGARDLFAMDFNGKSDPYCKLIHGRDTVSTAVKKRTLECTWKETFTFPYDGLDKLTLEIYDYDFIGADDLMGKLTISNLEKFMGTVIEPQWYVLEPPYANWKGGSLGEVQLRISMIDGTAFRNKVLHVTVHAARGLKAQDWGIMQAATSDPFAVVSHGRQKAQSHVVYKNLSPEWESYHICWFSPAHDLCITIMDHDRGVLNADDFLGQVTVAPRNLEIDKPVRQWYKCEPEDEMARDGQDLGEVELSVRLSDAEPYKNKMLRVKIHSARELAKMDMFGGKSDPWLLVRHGSQNGRTATKWETLEPEWNTELAFVYKPIHDLEIIMYDHDDYFFVQSSELAGQIRIPVNRLEFQETTRKWYTFTKDDDLDSIPLGELEVELEWVDSLEFKDSTLVVSALQGRGLKACDFGGLSDPYPIIKHGKQERKGEQVNKSLDPTWGFSSKIEFVPHQFVEVHIYDHDESIGNGDDFMGCVKINVLDHIKNGESMHKWLPLCDLHGREKALGEVEIRIEWKSGRLQKSTASTLNTSLSALGVGIDPTVKQEPQ